MRRLMLVSVVVLFGCASGVIAGDWPLWRGVSHDGTSSETGLVSRWTVDGENMVWKAPFIGRSTPVVTHGQVCAIGRVGDGITKQEVVACWDAETGKQRWERRHNVYHTTVAFNRLGWAALAADAETGNIYAHGAAGQLIAFDKDGEVLWERFTYEDFGRASGYGGRTQTPIVYGDQLLITFVTVGWGDQAIPRQRYYSFDKRTGEVQWISTPGGRIYDMNTQSGPVVAEIGGRHLLIGGAADGYVHGMDVATGETVWSFPLSQRGLNSTVLVAGDVVFAAHGEENLDDATQGRVVAFRASGEGDLSGQELWRINEMKVGFPSPAYKDGKLYIVDNSANLYRIDARNGKVEWEYNLGTVGKASPVVADNKLFVPEVNGRFHILQLRDDAPSQLDLDELQSEGERYAEIYASPAVAYGRVYLVTEGWLYCIGNPGRYRAESSPPARLPRGEGKAAYLRVVPAEAALLPGESVQFRAHAFDARGLPLGPVDPGRVTWKTDGIDGALAKDGTYAAPAKAAKRAGAVIATSGELTASARVRALRGLPWSQDFEDMPVDSVPGEWIGAKGKFNVVEIDGGKALVQAVRERGLQRSQTLFGGDLSDYTIQADVKGAQVKRRITDVGVVNSGYVMDLMGYHQRIEIRSWAAEKRMARTADFSWDMDTWYTIKFQVREEGGKVIARGKVWKRGEAEPEAWTITAQDPLPITHGSPGLIGYAPAEVHYDNIRVWSNQ